MEIKRVTDASFKKYGQVIDLDTEAIIKETEKIKYPESGSAYVPTVKEFEALPIMDKVKNEYFGGLETQLGYCWGYNNEFAALEWHKCSEINIATEDLIVLLGDVRDIDDENRYDSSKVEAFKVLKGEALEVYATTLHYCPIQASEKGFGWVVGLLKDTNTDLKFKPDDKLITATNKWLLAHAESEDLVKSGAFVGVYGENYKF